MNFMAEQILAEDLRHTSTREDIKQAILRRTTRGMLTHNSGKVHHLEALCAAVAAVVLGDPARGPEVREEVERELGGSEA